MCLCNLPLFPLVLEGECKSSSLALMPEIIRTCVMGFACRNVIIAE